MSYYVETLNAGDRDRKTYKRAKDIVALSEPISEQFDAPSMEQLVRGISEFDITSHLSAELQMILLSNFGKVKDRPMTYIYTILSWANDLNIGVTKKALRGAYKKTFGSQLDYRYVRVVSNFFKLKFYKRKKAGAVTTKPSNTHQETVINLLSGETKVNPDIKVVQNDLGLEWEDSSEESEGWTVEQPISVASTTEVSIEPTENLDAILVKQKETIKSLMSFLQEKDLMYEYLVFKS